MFTDSQINYHNDDVIKWKHFPRNWPFVRRIHRSPVNSPHKGQWHGALMFSLNYVWINGWVNNREAGDLRRYRAHYDVTVMITQTWISTYIHYKMWGEIIHPFPNFIGAAVEVWKLISNFIPHFTGRMISYPFATQINRWVNHETKASIKFHLDHHYYFFSNTKTFHGAAAHSMVPKSCIVWYFLHVNPTPVNDFKVWRLWLSKLSKSKKMQWDKRQIGTIETRNTNENQHVLKRNKKHSASANLRHA